MCNGNCNEGRNCPDWKQCQVEEFSLVNVIKDGIVAVACVALISLIASVAVSVIWGAQ